MYGVQSQLLGQGVCNTLLFTLLTPQLSLVVELLDTGMKACSVHIGVVFAHLWYYLSAQQRNLGLIITVCVTIVIVSFLLLSYRSISLT